MSYQSAFSASESEQAEYIRICGENGAETVVDTWLDNLPELRDDRGGVERAERVRQLRLKLVAALRTTMTDLELAEAADVAVGGEGFEEWRDNQ